jgi:hypothetical protein
MQLDDLKGDWAAHGAMLERSLAINESILRRMVLREARVALAPWFLWRALEIALGIAALLMVVPVLAAHIVEPRYVAVAGTLTVFSVYIMALVAYALVTSLRVDFGGPVTSIQREVERIKLAEYRALKWAVLGGVVFWLPAALVLFEALTGVDALARVNIMWVVANLLFGLVILGIGQALSRKYVERSDLTPWARRIVDAASGRGLRSAADHLAELSRFEREEA